MQRSEALTKGAAQPWQVLYESRYLSYLVALMAQPTTERYYYFYPSTECSRDFHIGSA